MQTRFDALVREHGPTVLRVCRSLLGPGADAEDAWSETFLAALRAWDRLGAEHDQVNHQAWLVRVAKNKCVDTARSTARRPSPVADVPEPTDGPPAPGTAAHEIWEQVAALPDKQRLAVALHFLGGLTHAETAEITGSTPPAVRRASADGIAALRQTLLREEGTT